MRQTQAVEAATFPFRERSLPFLSHLENLWPVIDSVYINNKKKTVAQGRTRISNPDLKPEPRTRASNPDLEPEPFVS